MNPLDWTRRRFLQTATGAAAGATLLPACGERIEDSASIAQQRKTLARRRRRIIVNNDGDDVVRAEKPEEHSQQRLTQWSGDLREDYLKSRTTGLEGTQVDTIFYASCAAGLTFSHQTKIGHFLDKATDPRCLAQNLIEQYERDGLGIQVDFCRQNDLEIFWSLRMNDRHHSYPMGSRRWTYGLAPFKRDHPEYVFGVPEDWEKYPDHPPRKLWSGVDYFNKRERAMELRPGKDLSVNLHVGSDVEAASVSQLRLRVHLLGLAGGEDLGSRLNGNALPQLEPASTLEANRQGHWLERLLEPSQIKPGENRFDLTLGQRSPSTKEPVLLDGLLLEVRHKG